ncbi:AAA domain-containing protein [Armillaria fumosa]|nr:AAA domain-containing protein [Armillaria fumosa]
MTPRRRLHQLLDGLASSSGSIGTLKLGAIEYEVPASLNPSRLPRSKGLLDIRDPANVDNLHSMLQKYLLGQDVFLVSQPGPYARRLALTFASIINSEYEYIALHRDVGETELKQGREIREGGNLVYVDSPAVNAAKHGRLLILEGIEKAERGIMPVLNNLLENREMNLDDGTHIIHPHRYALLDSTTNFIPAHKNFRVIAIAAPVPPYPGYPLDPPFRSRFQARFMDPVGAMISLSNTVDSKTIPLYTQIRDIILSTQYSTESRHALETVSKSALPPFPQTALLKLRALLSLFPPPEQITPSQLGQLFLVLHPALIHAPFQAWALLSTQTEDSGLGPLGSPSMVSEGLLGYHLVSLKRTGEHTADATFDGPQRVVCNVPAGPKALLEYPLTEAPNLHVTERFVGLLTCFMQAHALGWDISLLPPAQPSTASTSTSTLVSIFGRTLGYEMEAVHMYKELGGRELVMRRKIQSGGATTWEPSPIIEAAWKGRMVHLSGLDVLGSTAGSLSRLLQDREIELWEGKRIVTEASQEEIDSGELIVPKSPFRIISTASKSIPLKDWLTEEHANMFFPIPSQPMSVEEEVLVLRGTGCASTYIETLLSFADKYRRSISADNVQKHRKLGTRSLVRIARRLVLFPEDHDLRAIISNSLLADFLPATERINLDTLLDEADIQKMTEKFHPSPLVLDGALYFPASTSAGTKTNPTPVPLFDPSQDRAGVESLVPHMDHFYDNSLQTGLMRDLAIDLELMHEHVVLLGNQGVGKNKIVDRLCQLLGRPREYIQLHRDTTVNQLMFTTSLEAGVLKFTDSPLLRAITFGRVIIIDEADKAPEHVVAIFRSLAGQSEMTLSDGRRVCSSRERENDIVVHPNFRLVLLANRPGYPFLGNHFLQVLGENFSPHSVPNPDQASERKLLEQLAPELSEDIIYRLVGAFQDLRVGYENGSLGYPYSLRELINLVRHMQAYPTDALGDALRNVFDFDIYKPETIDKLGEILRKHGLTVPHLGLDAARESAKKIQDIQFEPKETNLSGPKEGKHDNEEHSGGNTYAGGTGGRDTAGMGGVGGYKRLWKGGDIKQVPDALKDDVPEHIKEKAREMAKQELQRRLEELDMNIHEARGYGEIIKNTQAHMASLYDLLEHLAAKEEERVWVKRQTDGELDDTRLTEGLTGEATVYKRRGMEKPELGRPQIKPKRIRFIFDLSASMYRFQYDGRLKRSLETAAMLMETFDRLSRKDKYVWDMYGHSGDGPEIPLVEIDKPPADLRDRWKVVEKMDMIPQYAFAGDYTVEAIRKGVQEVGKFDADDWFVIAITDANFGRYNITPEELSRAMKRNPKVHTALICIGEGAEAPWISKQLPGQGFRVANTSDIPTVLRSILSTMIDHA